MSLRKLGDGATSSVYLGHDAFANRDVAIKLVTQSALKDAASANVTHHLFIERLTVANSRLTGT